ncbi:hypothetical protein [Streptacidiphilus neutrinimicus]|uniref:hypothetical protein n=1 Tax=Streptacidiphilus neutrinimicus TaxID=105420 RepID=UPI000A944289
MVGHEDRAATDAEIAEMCGCWIGLAALLAGRLTPAPARVGVLLSGGNVGARRFTDLLADHP